MVFTQPKETKQWTGKLKAGLKANNTKESPQRTEPFHWYTGTDHIETPH